MKDELATKELAKRLMLENGLIDWRFDIEPLDPNYLGLCDSEAKLILLDNNTPEKE